jgi:hypothetical protein
MRSQASHDSFPNFNATSHLPVAIAIDHFLPVLKLATKPKALPCRSPLNPMRCGALTSKGEFMLADRR